MGHTKAEKDKIGKKWIDKLQLTYDAMTLMAKS